MKIKDLTNAPAWLMNAIVSGEDVEIDIYGRVVWHGGVWHGGDWRGGDWLGGDWLGGDWLGGDWHGGVWHGGDWHGGVWHGGVWHGGVWLGGDWRGGVWRGGVWRGGDWLGGDWRGGDWRGGDWLGGDWRGGVWRGGDWRGGVWRGEKITRPPVEVTNLPHWHVTISDTRMEIGCQLHTHSEWAAFDDAAIVAMDRKALRFWRTYKGALLYMCAARATKEEEA